MEKAPEKGLDNPTGMYNCFINVIIQSLWHIEAFKNYFFIAMIDHHPSIDELKIVKTPVNIMESDKEGGIIFSSIYDLSDGKNESDDSPDTPILKKTKTVNLEDPSTFCLICSLNVF